MRCSVGIDLSRNTLDIFVDAPAAGYRVANQAGDIAALVERLSASGKVSKVALTACSRKLVMILNAMPKDKARWDAGRAPQTG